MSEELFTVQVSDATPLSRARESYAKALEAYEKASQVEDDTGEEIPASIRRELRWTQDALRREEQRALNQAKGVA